MGEDNIFPTLFSYIGVKIIRKRTKFGVDKTDKGIKDRQSKDFYTGETITFMSKLERQFYEDIVLVGMNDGSIKKYELQVKYQLQPAFKYKGETILAINYISDFDIYYSDGRFVVVDTKGAPTPDAKIKAKIFKHVYPDIDFRWVSYTKATGWIDYNELQKIRRTKKKNEKKKAEENCA